jgi:hypothetical protein
MQMPTHFEAAIHGSFLRVWRGEDEHDEWINVSNIYSVYVDIRNGVGTVFVTLDPANEHSLVAARKPEGTAIGELHALIDALGGNDQQDA